MRKNLLFIITLLSSVVKAQTDHWETAVYESDNWSYVVPSAEPDTNWRKIAFNASSWSTGHGGFGYGDGDDTTVVPTCISVFIRIPFTISDTSKISEAILNADYDDGFVAYLNNVEIARANMSVAGKPPYNTTAAGSHEAVMYTGGNPDYFNISESSLQGLMVPGINILSIQIHNASATSSDLSGRFWLSFGLHDTSVLFSQPPSWFNAPVSFISSNLPIVVINTLNAATIIDAAKIQADMGIIYNGAGNRNHMVDPWNNYNGRIGIEIRGSSSQGFPKKSYGFEVWDQNNWPRDTNILNMPPQSDWCLIANYTDKSLMNNKLSYDLSRQMGWWAPRGEDVEVVLNGEYIGVYLLCEKIKRDTSRVDISKLSVTDVSGDAVTGGYIIKIDKGTGNGGGGWTSPFAPSANPNGQTIFFQYEYPADININIPQQAYIQAYVDSFETALAGPNFMDPNTGYAKYIDVNSFIDYFMVDEMSRNVDGYRLSTYFYKDRYSKGGKIVMGPTWDYDISWGNANYCNGWDTTGWAYQFGNVCSGDYWQIPFWWDRLMQDSAFQDKVRCRWEELRSTILSPAYLDNYCDSMGQYLQEGQQRNFAKWPTLGTYIWPNPSPIPTTYQGEVDELKNFINGRFNWLDANMPGTLNGCNVTSVNENSVTGSADAFPNPFTSVVNLSIYQLNPVSVKMELYNAMGQLVQPAQTQMHNGGTQNIVFTPQTDLPSGVYMLRITAGNMVWTKEMVKE